MNYLKLAGWVARTRPLTGPLSPRGPQPVLSKLQTAFARLNGPADPAKAVPSLSTRIVSTYTHDLNIVRLCLLFAVL